MFTIHGRLRNIFETPAGVNKDGKKYEATTKAQIECEMIMKNGEKKLEILTLTVPSAKVKEAKDCIDTDIAWPCGIFASGNKITAYLTA